MDSKKIATKIKNLPICADGQQKVKELVEALGFKVEEDKIKPKIGEVWEHMGDICLIVTPKGMHNGIKNNYEDNLFAITLDGKGYSSNAQKWGKNYGLKIANSLKDYYSQRKLK